MLKRAILFAATAAVLVAVASSIGLSGYRSRDDVAATSAAPDGWMTDILSAIRCGRQTQRDTLLLFSSNRGQPRPESVKDSGRVVCLVEPPDIRDHPDDTAVSVWAQRLNVTQLPQVVMLDPDGRPYARQLLRKQTDLTSSMVDNLVKQRIGRDDCFARAVNQPPEVRAALLARGLEWVGEFSSDAYGDVMREIVSLDRDGTMGLRDRFEPAIGALDIDDVIQHQVYPLIDQADLAGALRILDQLIARHTSSGELGTLMAFKGQLLFSMGKQAEALQTIDLALAHTTPGSPEASQIAAVREKVAR